MIFILKQNKLIFNFDLSKNNIHLSFQEYNSNFEDLILETI
jgi:hypothetical protein